MLCAILQVLERQYFYGVSPINALQARLPAISPKNIVEDSSVLASLDEESKKEEDKGDKQEEENKNKGAAGKAMEAQLCGGALYRRVVVGSPMTFFLAFPWRRRLVGSLVYSFQAVAPLLSDKYTVFYYSSPLANITVTYIFLAFRLRLSCVLLLYCLIRSLLMLSPATHWLYSSNQPYYLIRYLITPFQAFLSLSSFIIYQSCTFSSFRSIRPSISFLAAFCQRLYSLSRLI